MSDTSTSSRPFLTAEWRHLAMLNYEIDPAALEPLLPNGTELDPWQGRILLSMVGFMFLDVKICGLPIPFHRNFEEVNLRFYVRRKGPDGWRRGVVFVRELVPRMAIAWTARTIYQEPYLALPMRHRIGKAGETPNRMEYGWRFRREENRLWVETGGEFRDLRAGEEAEFITEHYWGYTRHRNGSTWEYQVQHPRWRVAEARASGFECDVEGLYGRRFTEFLAGNPVSALVADGSPITVHYGRKTYP